MHMVCDFSLDHYKEIINNALSAGYTFSGFQEPAKDMQIYLRHDVDVSLDMALQLAQVDADLGVRSTFFVLPNAPTYNILEDDAIDKIEQMVTLGHYVGLHIDLPKTRTNTEQTTYLMYGFYKMMLPIVPVVSYHRPSQLDNRIFGMQLQGLVNTYENRFMKDCKYISDSSGQWKEGCPCHVLADGVYPRVQLLTHPLWWVSGLDKAWDELVNERKQVMAQYLASGLTLFKNVSML